MDMSVYLVEHLIRWLCILVKKVMLCKETKQEDVCMTKLGQELNLLVKVRNHVLKNV